MADPILDQDSTELNSSNPVIAPHINKVIKIEEQGSTGTELVGGYLDEDYLQEFKGTEAADLVDKMRRSDSKVKMMLNSMMNPIRGARFSIHPGEDTELAKRQAEFCEYALFEAMDKKWRSLIGEVLTCIPFGYSLFERVHKTIVDHPLYGTKIGFRNFAFRSQRTIERWLVEQERLVAVEQYAFGDSQKSYSRMDARWLTLFTIDREGNNYEGVSVLRPAYGAWLRKQKYLKLNAVGIEKSAVPVPTLTVPDGKHGTAEYSRALDVLKRFTSHQSNYLTIPEGWGLEVFNNQFDPSKLQASVDAENLEIIDAAMAAFIMLGRGGGGGSYALSNDLSDFFFSSLVYIADMICEVFDESIKELVDLNWGEQSKYPYMRHEGITDKAGDELANILQKMGSGKFITPDDRLEDSLRERLNLPERDPETTRKVEPQQSIPFSENIAFGETARSQITLGSADLRVIMEDGLKEIGTKFVDSIMAKAKAANESRRINATTGVSIRGAREYRDKILAAITMLALESTNLARKEVGVKLIKFAEPKEFEKLPLDVQKRLQRESQLIVDTQLSRIENDVKLQYASSIDSTGDLELVRKDLTEKVDDVLTSPTVVAGAGNLASYVVNTARTAAFFQPDTLAEISAFRFVNPDPVSPICQDLVGRVFSKDDPEADRFNPPLHHNAVLSGTMILTPAGDVPIESLKVGDMVLTHEARPMPVKEVMDRFEDKHYFEVELSNGKRIDITAEHPVLTERGWKRVDELLLSDDIICFEDIQGRTMAKIVSVKRKQIEQQRLWNLSVETDESFIANGIVVHNCKSYLVPVLVKNNPNPKIDERGLKPSDPKLEKYITLSENERYSISES